MLILGLRSLRNRSLLGVNEDFEGEHNDKVALLYGFYLFLYITHRNLILMPQALDVVLLAKDMLDSSVE